MSHIYENDTKPILWSDHHVHVELVRCPARASHDWPGTSAGA